MLSLLAWAAAQRSGKFRNAAATNAGSRVLGWKAAHALPVVVLFVAMALASGCGGGGGTPTTTPTPPTVTGTPAGTYTLSVTAVSGNVTHVQTLTLVVQ